MPKKAQPKPEEEAPPPEKSMADILAEHKAAQQLKMSDNSDRPFAK